MNSLAGRVILVTGSSRGIGRAVAEKLGTQGATVIVNYVADAAAAHAVVEAIRSSGAQAVALQASLSDEGEARGLIQSCIDRFGRLDGFVNNAHSGSGRGLFESLPMSAFDEQVAALRGQFVALQECARKLSHGGCIINVSSNRARLAVPGSALYSAMKAALEQWTRVLCKELGHKGINVNTVSPGITDTDRISPEYRKPFSTVPAGSPPSLFDRLGKPAEIAEVIAFLMSPAGRWINGQTLLVNGGSVL